MTYAEDLAELVAELVDGVHTRAAVTRYRDVRRGDRTVTTVIHEDHHTDQPCLLAQLHAVQYTPADIPVALYRQDEGTGQRHHVRTVRRQVAGVVQAGGAVPSGSPGWDESGALNPLRSGGFESASPTTGATDLLLDIEAGVSELRSRLRAAAGLTPAERRSTSGALRELVGLVLDLDDDTAEQTVRRVRSWVSAARVLLKYDAPVTVLKDVYCRKCRGALCVREDASTAVWCEGRPDTTVAGPPRPDLVDRARAGEEWPVVYPAYDSCGQRYPRGSWIGLLEQAEKERGGS